MSDTTKKLLFGAVVLPLVFVLCTGFWDEIPRSGITDVVALGISSAKKSGDLTWTFVMPDVTVTSTNISNVKSKSQYRAVSTTQPSLTLALGAVQARIARKVYLDQLKVLALSDTMDRRTINNILDSINQWGGISQDFWVVTGSPPLTKWLLASPANQLIVPQYELGNLFSCRCLPIRIGVLGWKLWAELNTPRSTIVIPRVQKPVDTIDQVEVYPYHGKPYLMTKAQTQGWAYLTGRTDSGTLAFNTPEGYIASNLLRSHASTRVKRRGTNVVASVTIQVTGQVVQDSYGFTPKQINSAIGKKIWKDCLSALDAARRTHSDPFGWELISEWPQAVGNGPPPPPPWTSLATHIRIQPKMSLTLVSK